MLRHMSSGPGFREVPAHAFRPWGVEEEDVESKQLDAQTTSAALKLEGRYPSYTNFTSAFDDARTWLLTFLSNQKNVVSGKAGEQETVVWMTAIEIFS